MIPRITAIDVRDRIAAGERIRFLDVRQPEEYAVCRIGDSPLIPLGDLHSRAGEIDLDDGELLVVYCHHGIRSVTAVAILQQRGIDSAASLNGGIDAWSVLVDTSVPRY
jgi:rhodanese-related sulfurtransferase